jgi:hypothetical protein
MRERPILHIHGAVPALPTQCPRQPARRYLATRLRKLGAEYLPLVVGYLAFAMELKEGLLVLSDGEAAYELGAIFSHSSNFLGADEPRVSARGVRECELYTRWLPATRVAPDHQQHSLA